MNLRTIFPRRYFSKGALPYWMIVFWDCAVIILAGLISVYLTLGGQEMIHNFWNYIQIWIFSLPVFIVPMFMFRTYGGVISRSLSENLIRVCIAIFLGGVLLQILSAILSDVVFPFRPSVRTTFLAVVLSAALQCLYRYVAKQVIPVDDNGKVKAFIPFRRSRYEGEKAGWCHWAPMSMHLKMTSRSL